MRINLNLNLENCDCVTPNYYFPLSVAIQDLLGFKTDEFKNYLKKIGLGHKSSLYNIFSFALRFQDYTHTENKIILHNPKANLVITAPLIDEYLTGQTEKIIDKKIEFGNSCCYSIFNIENVSILRNPDFKEKMKFSLFSPIVLCRVSEVQGKNYQYFLRPGDQETNDLLTNNLKYKYRLLHNKPAPFGRVLLNWDRRYIDTHKRITKKISILQNKEKRYDIIGIQAPFTIEGDPELIKVGYETGFGEKNSIGFGMAEGIRSDYVFKDDLELEQPESLA